MNSNDDIYLYDLADLFKILGDSTRIKILSTLFTNELCVNDICKEVGLNKSAVSHQLRILKDYKLVKRRKEGKNVFYSFDDDHVINIYKLGLEHIKE